MPQQLFSIYRFRYGTHISSVNDALVSSTSLERAQSLLEEHLQNHPFNPSAPELDKITRFDRREELFGVQATASKVLYCSVDTKRELDGEYQKRKPSGRSPWPSGAD